MTNASRREKGTGTYTYRASEGRWRGEIRRKGRRYFVHVPGPNDSKTETRIKAALKDLARELEEGRPIDVRRVLLGPQSRYRSASPLIGSTQ